MMTQRLHRDYIAPPGGFSARATPLIYVQDAGGVMYKDERDIFYYDAVSHVWNRKYTGLQPYPHYELARVLKKVWKAGKAEVAKGSQNQTTYITDLKFFKDRCELLIGFSDPNAADPTFNDQAAKQRRTVKKEGAEGLEHSAHIVWHYKNKTNNKACALYLEGASGLSSTAIVRFINTLLRLHAKSNPTVFTAPDPEGALNSDGSYKRIVLRPRIELRGHPSAEFIKDLKGGELAELELITESHATDTWDANGYAVEEHRGVLLKPSTLKHVPKAKAIIDGVLKSAVKTQYEKARVSFTTAGKIKKNVKFYSQNYQLINDLRYVKKSRIKELGGNLPNAFDKLHLKIIRKMRQIGKIAPRASSS